MKSIVSSPSKLLFSFVLVVAFGISNDVKSQNLALGKTVTATSYSGTSIPQNANDNNLTTNWASSTYNSTLTIDLGANFTVNTFFLRLMSGSPVYTLEVFNGSTWAVVANSSGPGGMDVVKTITPVVCSQVRFKLIGWVSPYVGSGLRELEIYNSNAVNASNLIVLNTAYFENLATFSNGANFKKKVTIDSQGLTVASGNVLIGKEVQANSSYKLDVAGIIRSNEVVINTSGADFVFHDSYRLPPLSQVEEYIKANKHLPEIPAAEIMQNEGANVGELTTKLLQKIEELTLYIIDQNKRIEQLENRTNRN